VAPLIEPLPCISPDSKKVLGQCQEFCVRTHAPFSPFLVPRLPHLASSSCTREKFGKVFSAYRSTRYRSFSKASVFENLNHLASF
jgi:hypothetical protein